MYLAPACTFWLVIGSLLLELRPMLDSGAFLLMWQRPAKFLAAAMMGFAVNSLAYIVIQVGLQGTSALGSCTFRLGPGDRAASAAAAAALLMLTAGGRQGYQQKLDLWVCGWGWGGWGGGGGWGGHGPGGRVGRVGHGCANGG
jgi:hypothetical protein